MFVSIFGIQLANLITNLYTVLTPATLTRLLTLCLSSTPWCLISVFNRPKVWNASESLLLFKISSYKYYRQKVFLKELFVFLPSLFLSNIECILFTLQVKYSKHILLLKNALTRLFKIISVGILTIISKFYDYKRGYGKLSRTVSFV